MRKHPSLFLFTSLLPATLLLGAWSGAAAQDNHEHAGMAAEADTRAPVERKRTMWSNAASWPGGKVPAAGDAVTIPRDQEIVLDVAPPALRSLTVDGKLTFSDNLDLELVTEWIYLRRGELEIGTEARPHTRKAVITLTDNVPDENINTMGDRGIVLMGGTLQLHGDRENSWTKLAKTAQAGASTIEVLNGSGWRKGDEIVLASTDFDPRQAEKRTVTAIAGNRVTLDRPLEFMHFGEITFGVDQRGEVGMLTRNIRIQASQDAEKTYFGGHIMAMPGSKMQVSGIELYRMGQNMHLARYPIHWHLVNEGRLQYIKNSSIHDTYSRCVTIHGTNHVRLENNVAYNNVGHCYFLEDAVESGNEVIGNIGIMTKCHPTLPCDPINLAPGRVGGGASKPSDHVLIPSDNTVSTFWITNPDNIYRNNVAAGSDQIGFWFAFPEKPIGQFANEEAAAKFFPRRTRVREFSGNTAHSNFDGMMFDRGPSQDGNVSVGGSNYHTAFANPADPNSEKLDSLFVDFTGYKNRHGAIWARGELHTFRNLRLADNAIGFTHAAGRGPNAYSSRVLDSLFVGESANIGNPRRPEEIAYGRSLPGDSDYPIRGYEYYDMRHDVENTTFVNYQPNATRDASALSYLMYTSFGMSTENAVRNATFVNSKPVSFPPVVRRWASDFGRGNAWRGAAIHDRDGSVGGVPNSYIVLDNGIASDDQACKIRPEWGAAICQGDFGYFALGGNMGFGSGPIADPIMLGRNGRRWEYTGQTTIRSGADVRVETGRKSLSLSLAEMENGSWVIFELPGFTAAPMGQQQSSLAALRSASANAYFKNDTTLWVKLFASNTGAPRPPAGGPDTGFVVSR